MRKDGIPYVQNPPSHPFPVKDLEDMTLEEIVGKYIKTCGKADGNVAVCSQCKSPCGYGKRAIQLLANKVYNDPPIPLYGGKTLIERAREENMKRREQKEKSNMSALAQAIEEARQKALEKDNPATSKRKNYVRRDGWWEESLASGDQTKWLMENMKLSKTQAKKKIYQYKYVHGLNNATAEVKKQIITPVSEVKVEVHEKKNVEMDIGIESKLEILLKQQEEIKKEIEKYHKLLDEAQERYDAIKKKTDILCSAMDILND